MPPVPRPIGVVTDNPSHAADVVVDAQAAPPEHVPVAENPLEVPANAQGLAANPLAEEVNASDAVELKLSPEKKPDS
jgi:hypothetical protein